MLFSFFIVVFLLFVGLVWFGLCPFFLSTLLIYTVFVYFKENPTKKVKKVIFLIFFLIFLAFGWFFRLFAVLFALSDIHAPNQRRRTPRVLHPHVGVMLLHGGRRVSS